MAQQYYDDEFRDRVPGGGFAGGMDMTAGIQPTPAPVKPAGDPQKLAAFRAAAQQAGVKVDETDANVYADAEYQAWQPGSTKFTQQPQTPAQQWNAQPAATGQNELMALLMSRAQQGTAIDRNDPNIRAQVDPYVAQQERAGRNYLDTIAERAGGRPINMQGEQRMVAERQGQNAGAFESEIIGRELAAKRSEIEQSLQLAVMTGNQQAAMSLQKELALLNDRARTADRTQQGQQFASSQNQSMDQFLRELALREWQLGDQSDLSWAQVGG
jgi:hypothetical protein